MTTAIEWTDATWNPVTGCSRVSEGCDNCYMFSMYPRLRGMGVPGYQTSPSIVSLLPERLDAPLHWTKPRKVFVNSMSDAFHRDVPDWFILKMFKTMEAAALQHGHIFQILTKRPGRVVAWWQAHQGYFPTGWPPPVWLGTSVETQKYAARIEVLSRVPARVRFVSAEPLLEAVDLTHWLERGVVNWLIVGGESGQRSRAIQPAWVRSLRDQCQSYGVAYFVKQLGSVWAKKQHALDPKGGNWSEWPRDIRIREYPKIKPGSLRS